MTRMIRKGQAIGNKFEVDTKDRESSSHKIT